MTVDERRRRATLWGVGSLRRRHDGAVAVGDLRTPRSSATSARRRDALDDARRRPPATRVLFCSMLSEAGQFWPLTSARCSPARSSRAPTRTRATRCASRCSCGSCEYRAVLGVTGAILDGLDALGHAVRRRVRRRRRRRCPPGRVRAARGGRAHAAPLRRCAARPSRSAREPGAPGARRRRRVASSTSTAIACTSPTCSPAPRRSSRTPTAVRGALDDGGIVPDHRRERSRR